MFAPKNILLGVSGGIAAYKAVEIVSRMKKLGYSVKVIMTNSATKFVTPLTFREISANPVCTSMWSEIQEYNVEHIALANWAHLVLIAPATANVIAKITSGIADDMLTTTVLATKAPIMLCPSMNTNMYENPITQANLDKAQKLGMTVMQPAIGTLACATSGKGRLPEPIDIVQYVQDFFAKTNTMTGLKVLVTAGGTVEPIDPVRYIGNRSSGKMGYAIAAEAASRGAKVLLVAGNTNLTNPQNVTVIKVETARQMQEQVLKHYQDSNIVVKAAAVADYCVQNVANEKIKKNDDSLTLHLTKNPDILKQLGKEKTHQFLVGFAAETNDLIENAKRKVKEKNLDMIVANDVSMAEAGFNHDTNIVKFIYPDGQIIHLDKLTKKQVAEKLFDNICQKL